MELPQDEIRLRIRAAMALAGVTSWEELAEKTGFSRSLVKDLGTPRYIAERKHLVNVAAACDVPLAWFLVPSLQEAVAEHAAGLEEAGSAARAFGAAADRAARRLDGPPTTRASDPRDEDAAGEEA